MNFAEQLVIKYQNILNKYGISSEKQYQRTNALIKDAIKTFMKKNSNVAIWCYGWHTKMLMSDFIDEIKSVRYIVDANAQKYKDNSGYQIIFPEELKQNNIDAVIISSFQYRKEIKSFLQKEYPEIEYLDFYEFFEKNGLVLQEEYYVSTHPHSKYTKIFTAKKMLEKTENFEKQKKYIIELVTILLQIKDFRLAEEYSKIISHRDSSYKEMYKDIHDLYNLEMQAAKNISTDHVLMLCFDSLRNKDICSEKMPLLSLIAAEGYHFKNAYSTSTSTYESLIPTYSGNNDLKTRYYDENTIDESQCHFIQEAIKQGRNIHFYTDMDKYIKSKKIKTSDTFQTATEKMWDFIIDASNESKGLYYIHVLFESHFSYPNPYVEHDLVASGTSMFFDFLPQNGGACKTDYVEQHDKAIRYLDDSFVPFLLQMKCRNVIFADHGGILLNKTNKLTDLNLLSFTYHPDLTKIPLIVRSPEMKKKENKNIISLMELPEIIECLLNKRAYFPQNKQFVKIQRSTIYNPDFHYLYSKIDCSQALNAFEAFVFEDGFILAIYENGYSELLKDYKVITDSVLKKELEKIVSSHVTVN